jgi:hypothetical protein
MLLMTLSELCHQLFVGEVDEAQLPLRSSNFSRELCDRLGANGCRIFTVDWTKSQRMSIPYNQQIKALWTHTDSKEISEHGSLISICLLSALVLLRFLSLTMLKYCFKSGSWLRREFMHAYVLGWITTLGLLLFNHATALLRVSVFFAVWDILDILCYRLYFVFVKSRLTQWTSATIRRTLVMATANVIEIVLGFAILYARIGNMRDTQFPDRCVSPISDLYFSITTITTVGFGDFVPADDPSRLLVSAEIVSGTLMLILILPALISIVSNVLHQKE